jgi:hypothetical protein
VATSAASRLFMISSCTGASEDERRYGRFIVEVACCRDVCFFFGENWDRLEWNYGGCSGCCGCVFGQNWKVQM